MAQSPSLSTITSNSHGSRCTDFDAVPVDVLAAGAGGLVPRQVDLLVADCGGRQRPHLPGGDHGVCPAGDEEVIVRGSRQRAKARAPAAFTAKTR